MIIHQFFNPENPSQIWTNDGVKMHPMPDWVQARLSSGKNLDGCILENKEPLRNYQQVDWTGEQGGINLDVVLCANPNCSKPLRNDKEDRHYGRSVGRPSDYCSDACKMKAYRKRKKTLRNVQHQIDEKLLPVSKRSNVVELSTAGKIIGVSGTVHRFPIAQQTVIKAPAPYIRSFDDLQSFFGGSK